jgi:hypothetical protein
MLRAGDSIICRPIEYFPPGGNGENVEWDFRGLEAVDDDFAVRFACDSDSVALFELMPRLLQKYHFSNDTLHAIGYETNLMSLSYDNPIALQSYPITYADQMQCLFHGRGTYCKKYNIESQGTYETEVDGSGSILFNEDDTLRNVLRVHRIYSSVIRQYFPADSLADTTNVKQRIEEHYLWYARGYRYPVFETTSVTIYNDFVPVSCQQRAYSTLPSDQAHLKDSLNRDIQLSDTLQQINGGAPPIHYQLQVNGSNVELSYTLDADASIQVLVCDRMGLIYRRSTAPGTAGEEHHLQINCSGFRKGVYVLYLNVNGTIISEIFEL